MLKIAVPKPCHEDWDKMSPNQQGRHCTACAKTVVDFTNMTDEEVQYFFINKKEERVCGRFKNGQLHRICIDIPENVLYMQMPLWKKFLVACLVVFSASLFSCDTTINGKKIEESNILSSAAGEIVFHYFKTHDQVGGMAITSWETKTVQEPTCSATTGISLVYVPVTKGNIAALPIIQNKGEEQILTGDTVLYTSPKIQQIKDSLKIKNPPKTDSADCNTMKYY